MRKSLVLMLVSLPFLSFNPNDHIVPDTEHDRPINNQASYEGYAFPNDPSSNNYFNDPNWPNVDPNARYNTTPQAVYYSPYGTYYYNSYPPP